MKKAFVTKVRPGSISEAIMHKLQSLGYEVTTPDNQWDIRRGYLFTGDYDVLVNTAGITETAAPDIWDWETTDKIVSTNLTGAISLTSEFVKATMGSPGVKTIIHLGSLWSRKHATDGAVYCASKAGLAHFVSCMGYDLNNHYPGEYVIVGLHPGNVDGTPLTEDVKDNLKSLRGFTDDEVGELYEGTITPPEIAEVVGKVLGVRWFNGENLYLTDGDKK